MSSGRLESPRDWAETLDRAGLSTIADVLARAECVRELPDRANYRLRLGEHLVHVKVVKGRREPLPRAPAGVPAPQVVFTALDPEHGAVSATLDLAPARPLDELLAEDVLDDRARRRVLRELAYSVADLHEAGFRHRDLYLNHVYVDPRPGREAPLAAIIDWDRMGRRFRALGRRVAKDVGSLSASIPDGTVSEHERLRFLILYLRRRRCPRDRRARRFARRVGRKAERIRRHVPRTPVGEAARPGGKAL